MSSSRKRRKLSIKINHDSNFNSLVSIQDSDSVKCVWECSSSKKYAEQQTGDQYILFELCNLFRFMYNYV